MPRIYGQAMSGGPLNAAHSHGFRVATVGALPKNVLRAYKEACDE